MLQWCQTAWATAAVQRSWVLRWGLKGSGLKVTGSGARVEGFAFGVRGNSLGFRVELMVFIYDFGCTACLGFRVYGLGFWVLGFRV
jgi:hypothetical protein